jgi:polygalacturonase
MKKCIALLCVWLCLAGLANANPPVLPLNINTNNVINITSAPYGAVGDGVTTNTTAIQSAINTAAAGGTTNGLSGGVVEIPAGTFLSGPLAMKTRVKLQIDAGATLLFLPEGSYPDATGAPPYPLAGTNLTDLVISGLGTIDGNGPGWWSASPPNRPYMIYFSKCQRVLIEGVTLENPPKIHIVFKNSAADVTIQGITINTVGNSPNTDGIDLIGTNCLVQNCFISAGDDNIALGSSSSSAHTASVVVTNCFFGTGHGMTIGSNTQGGISNLTVINCTFSGTDYGIRMKSDNASSGGNGRGGLAEDLNYLNLRMTNIVYGPIVIYSYYNEVGTPTGITPMMAATQAVDTIVPNTPVWRGSTISNLTATVGNSGVAGIIWARTELPLTNITLSGVSITAPKSFDIYNAYEVRLVDSQIASAGGSTLALFNADVTVTNSSAAGASPVSFDGVTTNGYFNT